MIRYYCGFYKHIWCGHFRMHTVVRKESVNVVKLHRCRNKKAQSRFWCWKKQKGRPKTVSKSGKKMDTYMKVFCHLRLRTCFEAVWKSVADISREWEVSMICTRSTFRLSHRILKEINEERRQLIVLQYFAVLQTTIFTFLRYDMGSKNSFLIW